MSITVLRSGKVKGNDEKHESNDRLLRAGLRNLRCQNRNAYKRQRTARENRSALENLKQLGEGTFLYDVTQEKLYVTISEDGVTCSTSDAADAPADVPPVLPLT